jgi:hypothetical protein
LCSAGCFPGGTGQNPRFRYEVWAGQREFRSGSVTGGTDARRAVFMAMTFVVFAAYGVCAAAVRGKVLARPPLLARIRKAFAASFVVLSGRLAVESR